MKRTTSTLLPAQIAKYTDEQKAEARTAYLSGDTFREISTRTGIPETIVRKWGARGDGGSTPGSSWTTEREDRARMLLDDNGARRKLTVSRMATLASDVLERGIEHLASRETPLTTNELERLSVVVSTLDKISRLDQGKSTENVSVASKVRLSLEDVQAVLKADPAFSEE